MDGSERLILALSDGRAGNAAQAEGLSAALADRLGRGWRWHALRMPASALGAALPAGFWHGAARVSPRALALAHRGRLPPGGAVVVVGAGRRVAPLVAAMGRAGARSVQILDPQMPLAAFDRVVVPGHDGLSAPNLIETLGAVGRVTPAVIASEAALWEGRLEGLPRPRLAVLLGGSGRMGRWGPADIARFEAEMARLAAAGWTLLVTASRRSDPGLVARLAAQLGPGPRALPGTLPGAQPAARHVVHDGSGENPYPAILGLSQATLVTEDSVNMASEAAAAGRVVNIFRLARGAAKARAFHATLAAAGHAVDLIEDPDRRPAPPLVEAARVAERLAEDLGLA